MPHTAALTSRTRILAYIFLIVGALFVLRLFYLQVVEHEKYSVLAASAQEGKFALPAERGEIYAKDGNAIVPLVLNEPVYTVFADPQEVQADQKVVEVMRRVAGGDVVDGFEELLKNEKRRYVILARQVTKKQADLIEKEKIYGVGLQQGQKRVYPEGNLGANMLGYVNTAGEGQYGLEGALNKELGGEPGMRRSLTDVNGVPLSVHSDENILKTPKNGEDVVLSIDRNIQSYVESALKKGLKNAQATKGSALVLDPNTGKVLAMATMPTYNPEKYYETAADQYDAFQNPIVSDPYEAGSGIKTLTMAAGINERVVTPDTTFNNLGYDVIDGIKIKNALWNEDLGQKDMTQVLQYSLNSGVMFLLKQMGGGQVNQQAREKLYDYFAKHYLFNKKTGIEQTNEVPGVMFKPSDEQGNNVRYATMSFGQGFNVTMLRAATAFSSIINGGTMYKPTLIEGARGEDGTVLDKKPVVERSNVISSASSKTIREMIHQARTRTFSSVDRGGYLIGGKTGTSQTIDPTTGKYRDDNAIATYTGFGGDRTPDYVVMIRIVDSKLPGFGGTVAAQPIFADISNWLLEYMRIPRIR